MSEAAKEAADSAVAQIKAQNTELALDLIEEFSNAPDSQLDASLRKECMVFDVLAGDPVHFLRNLLDKAVHTGGASNFTVKAMATALQYWGDEDPKELAIRRSNLAKEMGLVNNEGLDTSMEPDPSELEEDTQ